MIKFSAMAILLSLWSFAGYSQECELVIEPDGVSNGCGNKAGIITDKYGFETEVEEAVEPCKLRCESFPGHEPTSTITSSNGSREEINYLYVSPDTEIDGSPLKGREGVFDLKELDDPKTEGSITLYPEGCVPNYESAFHCGRGELTINTSQTKCNAGSPSVMEIRTRKVLAKNENSCPQNGTIQCLGETLRKCSYEINCEADNSLNLPEGHSTAHCIAAPGEDCPGFVQCAQDDSYAPFIQDAAGKGLDVIRNSNEVINQ